MGDREQGEQLIQAMKQLLSARGERGLMWALRSLSHRHGISLLDLSDEELRSLIDDYIARNCPPPPPPLP